MLQQNLEMLFLGQSTVPVILVTTNTGEVVFIGFLCVCVCVQSLHSSSLCTFWVEFSCLNEEVENCSAPDLGGILF